MTIVRRVLISLIVLILLLGVIGWFLPSTARVERTTTINAPIDTVYGVIVDFQQFNNWSPWFGLDPNATYEISGTNGMVGSRFEWRSEKPEVGSGSQTITALRPPGSVMMRLEFDGQTPADNFFELKSVGNATQVLWGFETELGANPYMHYFSLLLDKFLGPAYEDGIARLKAYIETDVNP